MQGLEALDQFKNFVSKIGGLGRYEDTYIVHAAEGETVVPMEVLDQNPVLKKRLFKTMVEMGIEPGRYIVGNELNSKNPITGQPEFFLKKIIKQIRKALPGDSEKYLGTIVGLATGNPYLGAIAGGVGSGMEGAISGGLTGYRSPGISNFGLGNFATGADKVGPMGIGEIFDKGGFTKFLTGEEGKSGLIASGGKFFGGSSSTPQGKATLDEFAKSKGFDSFDKVPEVLQKSVGEAFLNQASGEASKMGMNLLDYLKYIGIGGLLLQQFEDDGDIGERVPDYVPTGETYGGVINQRPIFARGKAEGGVMDLQDGGESKGPGTGTSDSIPAMLSDGEFVMTAKAVRGAGGGDRREGARKMYEAMDRLEARG